MYGKCLFLFAALTLLSSCRTVFTMDTIMQIRKGDTSKDVQKMVDLNPRRSYAIRYMGDEYYVNTYSVLIGVKTTQESNPVTTTTATGIFSSTSNSTERKNDLSIDYFFLFDSDKKLIFWGFLQEFSKNEDAFLSGIAPLIQEKYHSFSDF